MPKNTSSLLIKPALRLLAKELGAQELCESRRPELPVPNKPTVSVDVKQHFNGNQQPSPSSPTSIPPPPPFSPSLISLVVSVAHVYNQLKSPSTASSRRNSHDKQTFGAQDSNVRGSRRGTDGGTKWRSALWG